MTGLPWLRELRVRACCPILAISTSKERRIAMKKKIIVIGASVLTASLAAVTAVICVKKHKKYASAGLAR